MANVIPKFSKDERERIFFHLSLALKLIFVVGIVILLLGYLNYKPYVCLLGAILAFLCVAVHLILYRIEIMRRIKTKRNYIIERTKSIEELLEKANETLAPIRLELSKKSSNTLEGDAKSSLNYLSLERLIEALSERLDEVAKLCFSTSEEEIDKAFVLLDSNLILKNKSTKHLLEHEIPDMPPHTWYDSVKFLLTKVEEDMKARSK